MARIDAPAERLGYAAARERVLAAAQRLPLESVRLAEARGRALAETIAAAHDLPPFRNSSMDGVAVCSIDLAGAAASTPVELGVMGEIAAGVAPASALEPGRCVWIMTGAPLPEGADAVVPIEDLESSGSDERVRIALPALPGQNIREAGADVRKGEPLFEPGRELSPHDVGLLAALGVTSIAVGSRPRVAALSTGDELLDASEPLVAGAIRDSNLPMLRALLEEAGARVVSAIRVGDDTDAVASAIGRSFEGADVVITIGGVSAGRHDPVKHALSRVEGIQRWTVAMKPGRPQAFGVRGRTIFFGLPGNPASVACVFEALVRPALRALSGYGTLDRPSLEARVEQPIGSRLGRTDFVRVTLSRREGAWWAREAGAQVSGHLSPQSRAHALLVVPENRAGLEAGDGAEALLLRWPDPA